MDDLSRSACGSYTPTKQDNENLKNLEDKTRRFACYWNARKIDPFMVNVVRGYFSDSLVYCVEKHRENPIDPDCLNKMAFVTLFEAWLIIGNRISKNSHDDGFLAHSADIFANAFLSWEVDPRNPDTGLKYSAHQPLPKTGIATTTIDGDDNWQVKWQIRKPGDIVLLDFPSLFWWLTLKEVAEFAILKGYPECLFFDLLSNNLATEAETTDQIATALLDTKPVYLDGNHPMFSCELSIAIEAWEQVLLSNPPKQKTGSRKKLIIEWLEKHHKQLPKEAKERIAKMLNPDGNGGAPSLD